MNAERFIREAIESVVRQTFDDWELLLVDDGSTDGSSRIAKEFAAGNPDKIRYLEHAGHLNKGMSASRNLGIAEARGEYVGFLDADDIWLPYKLEEQVAIMRDRPEVDMLFGFTQYWRSWTGEPEELGRDRILNPGVPLDTVIDPPALLTSLYPLGRASAPSMSNILIRRSGMQVLAFEESFRGLYEDQVFLAKAYLTQRILVTGRIWDRYRRHPESCVAVSVGAGEYEPTRKRYLAWLASYLEGQRVQSAQVKKALRYALWPYQHPLLNRLAGPIADPPVRVLLIGFVKRTAHALLPKPLVQWLRRLRHDDAPVPVGAVRMGTLRRLEPLSRDWGFDRGRPVDRYYIEQFLSSYAGDIRGRVLEVANDSYTKQFGGDRVRQSEVLDLSPRNSVATMVADLSSADGLPSDAFDCLIVTQTLHVIYDIRTAIANLHRALKPGGVLLVTLPGISQIARDGEGRWHDCWRFTDFSARRLFEEFFPPPLLDVQAHGNVLVATAFLQGMSVEDLQASELEHRDHDYQLVITVRAAKPATG